MDKWRNFVAACFLVSVFACASPDGTNSTDVEFDAATGELGGMCGGIAGFQCKAEHSYCKSERGICSNQADYSGICTVKPEACTMQYDPVCGCDGNTYGNACSAAGNGVSIAHEGECAQAS